MELERGRGRRVISETGEKSTPRQIRLTDDEWKTFREKLGIAWLRKQIKVALEMTSK